MALYCGIDLHSRDCSSVPRTELSNCHRVREICSSSRFRRRVNSGFVFSVKRPLSLGCHVPHCCIEGPCVESPGQNRCHEVFPPVWQIHTTSTTTPAQRSPALLGDLSHEGEVNPHNSEVSSRSPKSPLGRTGEGSRLVHTWYQPSRRQKQQ